MEGREDGADVFCPILWLLLLLAGDDSQLSRLTLRWTLSGLVYALGLVRAYVCPRTWNRASYLIMGLCGSCLMGLNATG